MGKQWTSILVAELEKILHCGSIKSSWLESLFARLLCCPGVCLSVCLSIFLSIWRSACLPVCRYLYLHISGYLCIKVSTSIYLFTADMCIYQNNIIHCIYTPYIYIQSIITSQQYTRQVHAGKYGSRHAQGVSRMHLYSIYIYRDIDSEHLSACFAQMGAKNFCLWLGWIKSLCQINKSSRCSWGSVHFKWLSKAAQNSALPRGKHKRFFSKQIQKIPNLGSTISALWLSPLSKNKRCKPNGSRWPGGNRNRLAAASNIYPTDLRIAWGEMFHQKPESCLLPWLGIQGGERMVDETWQNNETVLKCGGSTRWSSSCPGSFVTSTHKKSDVRN